jgi:hypothetical protein
MNGERFEEWFENSFLSSVEKGKTIRLLPSISMMHRTT